MPSELDQFPPEDPVATSSKAVPEDFKSLFPSEADQPASWHLSARTKCRCGWPVGNDRLDAQGNRVLTPTAARCECLTGRPAE